MPATRPSPNPKSVRLIEASITLRFQELDAESAPGINSIYGEYLGADFILLAQGMDIHPALAKKWLSEIINNHQLIIDTYTESHMPEAQRETVLDYVARRITLLAVTEL